MIEIVEGLILCSLALVGLIAIAVWIARTLDWKIQVDFLVEEHKYGLEHLKKKYSVSHR